jgi:hypothetical protein
MNFTSACCALANIGASSRKKTINRPGSFMVELSLS